jgi:hypothetical protein
MNRVKAMEELCDRELNLTIVRNDVSWHGVNLREVVTRDGFAIYMIDPNDRKYFDPESHLIYQDYDVPEQLAYFLSENEEVTEVGIEFEGTFDYDEFFQKVIELRLPDVEIPHLNVGDTTTLDDDGLEQYAEQVAEIREADSMDDFEEIEVEITGVSYNEDNEVIYTTSNPKIPTLTQEEIVY